MDVANMEIVPDSLYNNIEPDNAAHPEDDPIEQIAADPNPDVKANSDGDSKDADLANDNEHLDDFKVVDVDDGGVENLNNDPAVNGQDVKTVSVDFTKTDILIYPTAVRNDAVIPHLKNETENSDKSTNDESNETTVDNLEIDAAAVKPTDTEKVCDSLILTVDDELENEEMAVPEKRKVAKKASELKDPLVDKLNDGKSHALGVENVFNAKDEERASETVNNNCPDDKNKTKKSLSSKFTSSLRTFWVSNITHSTKASGLKQFLSKAGKVITAKIVSDGRKCYGYIIMENAEVATQCIKSLNGVYFEGRKIVLSFRKPHRGIPENMTKDNSKSVKEDITDDVKAKSDERSKVDTKKTRTSRSKSLQRELSKRRASKDSPTTKHDLKRSTPSRSRRDTNSSSRDNRRYDYLKEKEERGRLRRRLLDEQRKSREDILREIRREEQSREAAFRLEQERRRLQLEKELFYKERKELSRIDEERKKIERERLEILEQRNRLQEEFRRNAMKTKAEEFLRSTVIARPSKDLAKDGIESYRKSSIMKDMYKKSTKDNRDETKPVNNRNDNRIDLHPVKDGGKNMKPFNDRLVPPPPKLTDDFGVLDVRSVRRSDGKRDYCDEKYGGRTVERGGRKIEVIDRKYYNERSNELSERKTEQRDYRKPEFEQRKAGYMFANRKYEFGREGKRYREEPYLKRDHVVRTHWPGQLVNYSGSWKSTQAGSMPASTVRMQDVNFGNSSYGGGHSRTQQFYFSSLSAGQEFPRYENSSQIMGRKY